MCEIHLLCSLQLLCLFSFRGIMLGCSIGMLNCNNNHEKSSVTILERNWRLKNCGKWPTHLKFIRLSKIIENCKIPDLIQWNFVRNRKPLVIVYFLGWFLYLLYVNNSRFTCDISIFTCWWGFSVIYVNIAEWDCLF